MYPAERHAAILAAARAHAGEVGVQELSESLGVTAETVRRDLGALERRGLLRRRHGGAVLLPRAPFEPTLQQRGLAESDERRAVARAVVAELPDEGVLLLDSGSMTLEIATLLASDIPTPRSIVVVTNSLPVAALLGPHPTMTVLALPGAVRPVTQGVVGPWTEQRLAELHADVAVLGANGVVAGEGAFTTLPEEAAVKRRMLAAASRRILAVTATKFGSRSLCRFAGLDRFDLVVTDSRLDPATADAVAADGPGLVLAPLPPHP
ncbi:DeoR/GlpR family DNA-binding transcription regulator [Herbiconiux ginsengi]|uniref:Lactose phosphotransferase system repressor n=1 Tax=Herbiconiux ginsengi TaxID=381665 RepID=A0A1H3QUD5_9MICO|nr:DeoR/GlpR family DNA-binding transcription regulator [Herbiconiux ginsengi]SDZ16930.1 transcriptional regulator, DeoR family [Herbiconiux ginsengi]